MNYYRWYRGSAPYVLINLNNIKNLDKKRNIENLWQKYMETERWRELEWESDNSRELNSLLKEILELKENRSESTNEILEKWKWILMKKEMRDSNTSTTLIELKLREGKIDWELDTEKQIIELLLEVLSYENNETTRLELYKRRERSKDVVEYTGNDTTGEMGALELEKWTGITYLGSGKVRETGLYNYIRTTTWYLYTVSILKKYMSTSDGLLKLNRQMFSLITSLTNTGIYSWWIHLKGRYLSGEYKSNYLKRNKKRWDNIINYGGKIVSNSIYWTPERGDWVSNISKWLKVGKYTKRDSDSQLLSDRRWSDWISSIKLSRLDKKFRILGRIGDGHNQKEELLKEGYGRWLGKTKERSLRRGKILLDMGFGYDLKYIRTGQRWLVGITGEKSKGFTGRIWVELRKNLAAYSLRFVKRNWKLLEIYNQKRILRHMDREIKASEINLSTRSPKSSWFTTLRGYTNHEEQGIELELRREESSWIKDREKKKERYIYNYYRQPWNNKRKDIIKRLKRNRRYVKRGYSVTLEEIESYPYKKNLMKELWGAELKVNEVFVHVSDISLDRILSRDLVLQELREIELNRIDNINRPTGIVEHDWWETSIKESWIYRMIRPKEKVKAELNWWLKKDTYKKDPVGIRTSTNLYKDYSTRLEIRSKLYKLERESIREATIKNRWNLKKGEEWRKENRWTGRELIWSKIKKMRDLVYYKPLRKRVIGNSEFMKNYNKTRSKVSWLPKYGFGKNVYYRVNQIRVGSKRDYKFITPGYKNIYEREVPLNVSKLMLEYDKKRYQQAYKVRRADVILLQNTGYLEQYNRLEDTSREKLKKNYYVHSELGSVIRWYKDGGVSELMIRRFKEKVSHKRKNEKYLYTVHAIRLESSREKWKELNILIDRWYNLTTLSSLSSKQNYSGVLGVIEQLEWYSNFRDRNWPYPINMFNLLGKNLKARGRVKELRAHSKETLTNIKQEEKLRYKNKEVREVKLEGYKRGIGKNYNGILGIKINLKNPSSIEEKKYWTLRMHISNLLNKISSDGSIDRGVKERFVWWARNWEKLGTSMKEEVWARSLRWTIRRLSKDLIYDKELYKKLLDWKRKEDWKNIFSWYISWKHKNNSRLEHELNKRGKLNKELELRIVDECNYIISLLIIETGRKTNILLIEPEMLIDRQINIWNPIRERAYERLKTNKVKGDSKEWLEWEEWSKRWLEDIVMRKDRRTNDLLYNKKSNNRMRHNILMYNKKLEILNEWKDLDRTRRDLIKWEYIYKKKELERLKRSIEDWELNLDLNNLDLKDLDRNNIDLNNLDLKDLDRKNLDLNNLDRKRWKDLDWEEAEIDSEEWDQKKI